MFENISVSKNIIKKTNEKQYLEENRKDNKKFTGVCIKKAVGNYVENCTFWLLILDNVAVKPG